MALARELTWSFSGAAFDNQLAANFPQARSHIAQAVVSSRQSAGGRGVKSVAIIARRQREFPVAPIAEMRNGLPTAPFIAQGG